MKKFPNILYVRGSLDTELEVSADKANLAVPGGNVLVGVYQLVNKGTLVMQPELILEDSHETRK